MIHNMPINFEENVRTFPFKIFTRIKEVSGSGEEKSYELSVAVEALSILYDYFNDKKIEIKDIGKFLPYSKKIKGSEEKEIFVCLNAKYTQSGLVITKADISLEDEIPEPKFESFSANSGIDPEIKFLISSSSEIGKISIKNNKITINQALSTNLTRYMMSGGTAAGNFGDGGNDRLLEEII